MVRNTAATTSALKPVLKGPNFKMKNANYTKASSAPIFQEHYL